MREPRAFHGFPSRRSAALRLQRRPAHRFPRVPQRRTVRRRHRARRPAPRPRRRRLRQDPHPHPSEAPPLRPATPLCPRLKAAATAAAADAAAQSGGGKRRWRLRAAAAAQRGGGGSVAIAGAMSSCGVVIPASCSIPKVISNKQWSQRITLPSNLMQYLYVLVNAQVCDHAFSIPARIDGSTRSA